MYVKVCTYLFQRSRCEPFTKGIEGELHGVPDLVAEVSVSNDPLHVQVDVTPLGSVDAQSESHCIRATLRDALRVVGFLCVMVGSKEGRRKGGREGGRGRIW